MIGFLFLFFISCTQKVSVKGYIDEIKYVPFKGLKSFRRAYYSFNYQDSTYTGSYKFGKFDPFYLVNDSVWVIFNKNKPGKSELAGIAYRPTRETKPVRRRSGPAIFVYHTIDQKPLFFSSKTPEDNDHKIQEYVYSKVKEENFIGKCDLLCMIVFSENGYIEYPEVRSSSGSEELDNFVINTLLNAPQGVPGRDKEGICRKCSFLVELKFE